MTYFAMEIIECSVHTHCTHSKIFFVIIVHRAVVTLLHYYYQLLIVTTLSYNNEDVYVAISLC